MGGQIVICYQIDQFDRRDGGLMMLPNMSLRTLGFVLPTWKVKKQTNPRNNNLIFMITFLNYKTQNPLKNIFRVKNLILLLNYHKIITKNKT
jgi:hypothetical protein